MFSNIVMVINSYRNINTEVVLLWKVALSLDLLTFCCILNVWREMYQFCSL